MTDRERAAFHESGHTVVGWIFGRAPRLVKIADDGTGNTICRELRPAARRQFSEARYRRLAIEEVYVWSAGAIAEELFTGSSDPDAACVDAERVRFWTGELGVRRGDLLARALTLRTKRMLRNPPTWAAVEAIAAQLLENGELSREEVDRLLRTFLQIPRAI